MERWGGKCELREQGLYVHGGPGGGKNGETERHAAVRILYLCAGRECSAGGVDGEKCGELARVERHRGCGYFPGHGWVDGCAASDFKRFLRVVLGRGWRLQR